MVYYHDQTQATVAVLNTVWDTARDADEFSKAFEEYASARFDSSAKTSGEILSWDVPDGYHEFFSSNSQTTWIIAPDPETARALRNAFGNP